MAQINIVVVTPETTTLDAEVESVTVPMFDGSAGILAGHAPMIGRLGPGELRTQSGGTTERYYVDGGFVQVEGNVVSVLTGSSFQASDIDLAEAKAALAEAEARDAETPELAAVKRKAVAQARAKVRVAEGS